jgi:predicted RND superfamily exporter protein
VLAAGAVLACAGWALDARLSVVSDLPRLVPQDLAAVRDLNALQHDTGVAGEVDVLVQARDLTDPKIVAWMRDYESGVLRRHGYTEAKGCGGAQLVPGAVAADLFRTPELSAHAAQVRALLDAVPAYFSQAAITPDRRTAVLAFGVRLQSLERQREVMQDMRARLHPPPGVRATLSGLPVPGRRRQSRAERSAAANVHVARRAGGVALALFAVYRVWARAWVPLVPIALATGWSSLVLWASGCR